MKSNMLESVAASVGGVVFSGRKVQASGKNAWIAKSDKGSVQDDSPEEAVTKFGKNYGTRGNLSLSENIRENGMLVFKRGCRSTKGKFKDVLKQAQEWDSGEVTASINKALFKHGDLVWHRVLGNMGLDLNENEIQLVQDLYYSEASKDENRPDNQADERKYMMAFVEKNVKRLHKLTGKKYSAAASTKVTADSAPLSDRVSSIVFGDVKRIRSTIASWKGKMPKEQYDEFVTYQKDIARFIKEKYVPRLSETYRKKLSEL